MKDGEEKRNTGIPITNTHKQQEKENKDKEKSAQQQDSQPKSPRNGNAYLHHSGDGGDAQKEKDMEKEAAKLRQDDEIIVLHKLIEQKRLEKVKRESIGRERSRTLEELKIDAIQTQKLENEIKKAEQKEEALFILRDAEERVAGGETLEVQEILEISSSPDVSVAPSPELLEEARREGMPLFKPTHTRSSYSLLPTPLSISRTPLSISIPAMLTKPPLSPTKGPSRSPPGHPPSSPPLSPLSSPTSSPVVPPSTTLLPLTPISSPIPSIIGPIPSLTTTPPPSTAATSSPPSSSPSSSTTSSSTSPSSSPTSISSPSTSTSSSSSPSTSAAPNSPTLVHHRSKHHKQNSVVELPHLQEDVVVDMPARSALELLKEQLAGIESTIRAREARIKSKEKEIDHLTKLTQKHQPKTAPNHLEICIVFDTAVSWLDKFSDSVSSLLLELKTLYEYTIKFALVECGGLKRFMDFQSIEDSAKIQDWLNHVKRCKGEEIDLIDYCVAMSAVASLSWSKPPWTRILLFFSGGSTTVVPDSEERLRDVIPLIKSLNLNYYFIRLLGKGEIPPLEKYLRQYNDLEKGLFMTEIRDGPSIIHDLAKKTLSRAQKREIYQNNPPQQLLHRLMTWEIIESAVSEEQSKTQIRRLFCKRWNFPFRTFSDLIYTLKRSLWNVRDDHGFLNPSPPSECVRVPGKFDVHPVSDHKNTTTRYMEIKTFKKQDIKFAARQLKVKDATGQATQADDCLYYTYLDVQVTAQYFATEFNAHLGVHFPGISPLLFPESFVVSAPQNIPGSNVS